MANQLGLFKGLLKCHITVGRAGVLSWLKLAIEILFSPIVREYVQMWQFLLMYSSLQKNIFMLSSLIELQEPQLFCL